MRQFPGGACQEVKEEEMRLGTKTREEQLNYVSQYNCQPRKPQTM
jgi:hypothetical protein